MLTQLSAHRLRAVTGGTAGGPEGPTVVSREFTPYDPQADWAEQTLTQLWPEAQTSTQLWLCPQCRWLVPYYAYSIEPCQNCGKFPGEP